MIILIADDERLVRFTLKSMLQDIIKEKYTLLEAENGKEMVAMCKEHVPDIVFVDIRMPYMNGIEAIEECKKFLPETQFVVISGHSEFEYARKCITLGINEYVLKPIETETLARIVKELTEKIQLSKKESNSSFQVKVSDYFNYYSVIGDEDFEEPNIKKGWQYRGIGFLGYYNKKELSYFTEIQKRIINKIREIGTYIIDEKGFYTLVYSAEGIPYFLFYGNENMDKKILSLIKKICVLEQDEKVAFHLCSFSDNTIKDIYNHCEMIDKQSYICIKYPPYSVVPFDKLALSSDENQFYKLLDKLIKAWENMDEISYNEILKTISKKYHEKKLDFNNIGKNLSYITDKKADINTFSELYQYLKDIQVLMYESVDGKESDVTQKIKDYIAEFYMNDISITRIADQFDLTPNYLSTLFHRKEGLKFVDYLTDIRMANAKRLLIQNPTASIGDIALMVGYNSQRHFSTLFQNATGVIPSIYRKGKNR